MLVLEKEKLEEIIDFLSVIGCKLQFLDYIQKDNTIYHAKTFEPVHDVLTYILIKYDDISELHFHFNQQNKNFDLRVRKSGNLISVPSIINIKDNYSTIQFGNNSHPYSTEYFKDILRTLSDPNSTKYGHADFINDVSIPAFGNYRLRMATLGYEGIIRLIKKDEDNNNNLLAIKPNPVYIFEAEIKDSIVNCNSTITLTPEIKEKITTYENALSKMFDLIPKKVEKFSKGINFYKSNKMKIGLEYIGENILNISIFKNYYIEKEDLQTYISEYLYDNYQDFYDPIFTNFVEDVTQIKIDPIIGKFKNAEDFKDYLLALKILKI